MKKLPWLTLSLLMTVQVVGCDLYTTPPKDLLDEKDTEGVVVAVQPTKLNRKLDLLFVIDDSGSMSAKQAALAAAFPAMISELKDPKDGMPDLHLAVVSTDLGTGPYDIHNCRQGQGDNGAFRGEGCVNGAFLVDEDDGAGGRTSNYQGSLGSAFSCMAQLGNSGCGFEQPLESMRRALERSRSGENAFLRPDAQLGVIFLTDEDDCSVADLTLFDGDSAFDNIQSYLGPLSSFRCFEFGVQCDGAEARTAGPRTGCKPMTNSPFLYDVQEYVQYLQGLKANPSEVFVAGIIGDPTPVGVSLSNARPQLDHSCASTNGGADPAVRMQGFLDAFGERSRTVSICNGNFSAATSGIAAFVHASAAGSPCLEGAIPAPNTCVVEEVRNYQSTFEVRQGVTHCDNVISPANSSVFPCYLFEPDLQLCSDTNTHLKVRVEYGSQAVPEDVNIVVTCAVELP